ncbi:5'-nucleotidase domain-containing protein [Anaeramoeba ignava]|uniref:5'-nucleotidase domain-containing protein n=1 Tax=Anaeramoeba ignava TaxID=1746090 RepID=A0A9Q0L6M1_ANAIG|nr:5'-nucleotidase domain-containing protein [Anaeramoeba ignava]
MKKFFDLSNQFKKTSFIGFDLDHCLVPYHIKQLSHSLFDISKQTFEKFEKIKLPKEFKFDFNTCGKGNVFDYKRGNILKIDSEAKVLKARHGSNKVLSSQEIEKEYGSKSLENFTVLPNSNYFLIPTFFHIGLAIWLAKMVDLIDSKFFLKPLSYQNLCEISLHARKYNFRDWNTGFFHEEERKTPEKFFRKNHNHLEFLEFLLKNNKKLFLITDSIPQHCNFLMTEIYGKDWKNFFEFIVYSAQKPKFFFSNTPFESISSSSNKEFIMGNFRDLETSLMKKFPKESKDFIFFGDDLISDITFCKKHTSWKTVAIVEELNENFQYNGDEFWEGSFLRKAKSLKPTFWENLINRYSDYAFPSLEEFYKNIKNSN